MDKRLLYETGVCGPAIHYSKCSCQLTGTTHDQRMLTDDHVRLTNELLHEVRPTCLPVNFDHRVHNMSCIKQQH